MSESIGGAIAPVNYQSPIPAFLNLLQYTGGTRSKSSSTTTSSANIDPLMQIFSQQSDPSSLMSLVEAIFQNAAGQVPGLTTQFANATGTRVTNNSMLGNSLAMLNQNLAQAISQSIVQQQANASQTAGRVADATKTETKSGTQKTGPGPNFANSLGVLTLLGSLMNKAGKAGPRPGGGDTLAGPAGSIDTPAAPDITPFAAPVEGIDFGSSPLLNVDTPIGTPLAASFADVGFDAPASTLSPTPDVVDTPSFEPSFIDESSVFQGSGDFFDFGSSFFADGGKIGKGSRRSYADGGLVNPARNMPSFGPRPIVPATNALTYNTSLINNRAAADIPSRRSKTSTGEASVDAGVGVDAGAESSPGSSLSSVAGAPGAGFGMGVGGIGLGPGSVANAVATALSLGLEAAVPGVVMGLVTQALVQAMTLGMQEPNAFGLTSQEIGQTQDQEDADIGAGLSANEAAAAAAAADNAAAASEDAGGGTGLGGGLGGAAEAGTGTDAGAAGGGSEGGDDGSGGGDDGGGGDFYDGGIIPSRSAAKKPVMPDMETINVTAGEYVVPVDVVDFVGADVLDTLIDLVHTPIRGGRRG
jgi:hypothetical protein